MAKVERTSKEAPAHLMRPAWPPSMPASFSATLACAKDQNADRTNATGSWILRRPGARLNAQQRTQPMHVGCKLVACICLCACAHTCREVCAHVRSLCVSLCVCVCVCTYLSICLPVHLLIHLICLQNVHAFCQDAKRRCRPDDPIRPYRRYPDVLSLSLQHPKSRFLLRRDREAQAALRTLQPGDERLFRCGCARAE